MARAVAIRFNAAGVTSSNARHTVAGEATGPSKLSWWRSVSMSAIASPPATRTVARSTSTRPRSWTGTNLRRANACDKASVSPTRSASSRTAAAPANGTTPVPSAVTDNPCDQPVRFTSKVLLALRERDPRQASFSQARSTFLLINRRAGHHDHE